MQAVYYFGNDSSGNAVLPAGGVIVSNQNGAPIRSIGVDNATASWLSLGVKARFVAPQTTGYVAAYDQAILSEVITSQAPGSVSSGSPGILPPVPPLSQSSIKITVSDEVATASPGLPYGFQQGPITGSKGQPIDEVLANIANPIGGNSKGRNQLVSIANVPTAIPQPATMANSGSILLLNTEVAGGKTIYWAFDSGPSVVGANSFPLLPAAAVSLPFNNNKAAGLIPTAFNIWAIVAAGTANLLVCQVGY